MSSQQEWKRALLLLMALTVLGCGLFSNSSGHAFHLDDNHSITENPALRSLANVPSFFVDAHTFSTLLTNADYRPVLQLSYALDYAVAGYRMPVWHWTQVAIHVWCAFFLYLFLMELLKLCSVADAERGPVCLLSALVFLIHPVNSGVINYISARSSQLTAAFLLAAFFLELKERRVLALGCFTLALFTKVEAVAALAVFWALSVLRHRAPLLRAAGQPREWLPYFAPTVGYLVARQVAMQGINFAGSAAGPDMTRWKYLCTQITAWWAYLFQWLTPLHLVADNMAYPVYTSPKDPAVALALVGWALVALLLGLAWARSPHFALLAFGGLALISPSSSVVPLSEMMNEHRPYLPMALVATIFVSGLVRLALALPSGLRPVLAFVVGVWLMILGGLTWQRNRVYLTEQSYWSDVVAKAPSGRAHNNLGLTFMKAGAMPQAQYHFEQSLRLAPQYSTAHTNLAIVHAAQGQMDEARRHHDLGVAYDRGVGEAHFWRGNFFLAQGQFDNALKDFQHAHEVSNDRFRVHLGLAHAFAGLGQPGPAAENALAAGSIDPERFGVEIVKVAAPFFTDEGQARNGLEFFAALEKAWPEIWWVHTNQASLLQRLGRQEEAAAKQLMGNKLKPPGN